MKRILIVTYYWPPSGGAGVQRWLKFSKYLPEFGWEPVILTVDAKYAAYPALDRSLEKDIRNDIKVFRTKATDWFSLYMNDKSRLPASGFAQNEDDSFKGKIIRFIRGNFFIPDPRRGWNRYAYRKACEIINSQGIRDIITTSPPHSTQLIGLKLKKKYRDINWIADLRDPWTDIYYYDLFYLSPLSRMINSGYEKKVLEKSDKIITVGNNLKKMLALKTEGIEKKIKVITNGYDTKDFGSITNTTPDIFTLTYSGTLSDRYPIKGLLEALTKIRKKGVNLKLIFTGSVSRNQKKSLLETVGTDSVSFIPYVNHETSIEHLSKSSVLLLIIPDHTSNDAIITGKLFEYIATGKPIICLGPVNGEAADILKETGHENTFYYDDVDNITDCLYSFSLTSDKYDITKTKPYRSEELVREIVSKVLS